MSKLNPCPTSWCVQLPDGLDTKRVNREDWAVECASCGVEGPLANSPEEAARAWNRAVEARSPGASMEQVLRDNAAITKGLFSHIKNMVRERDKEARRAEKAEAQVQELKAALRSLLECPLCEYSTGHSSECSIGRALLGEPEPCEHKGAGLPGGPHQKVDWLMCLKCGEWYREPEGGEGSTPDTGEGEG